MLDMQELFNCYNQRISFVRASKLDAALRINKTVVIKAAKQLHS